MKKYLIFLPMLALALASCVKTTSYESINMDYDQLETNVLSADAQTIQVGVNSTHSFRLHSDSSFVSFDYNGLVNYDKSGVAMVRTVHNVHIAANESGTERIFFVQATNKYNTAMSSSLMFKQLAKDKKDEQKDEQHNEQPAQ